MMLHKTASVRPPFSYLMYTKKICWTLLKIQVIFYYGLVHVDLQVLVDL